MKKLFLLIAFTGIIGASSAITVSALTKGTVITLGGEEKKDKKKKCDKKKACCKKDASASAAEGTATTKTCAGDSKKKACCKSKGTAAVAPEAK